MWLVFLEIRIPRLTAAIVGANLVFALITKRASPAV
jgi:hypothetical protein